LACQRQLTVPSSLTGQLSIVTVTDDIKSQPLSGVAAMLQQNGGMDFVLDLFASF
jgi:hypothetical protein